MSKLSESQKEEIKDMISEKLCVDLDLVQDHIELKDGLGADSLDVVDIVMGLDSKFDISIPDDDYNNKITVQGVYEIVERYIQ